MSLSGSTFTSTNSRGVFFNSPLFSDEQIDVQLAQQQVAKLFLRQETGIHSRILRSLSSTIKWVLLSVVPSNLGICYSRAFATGILWTLSSSLTFVKTQKFLLIFQSRIRLTSGEMKRAKYYEIGSIIFCLFIQISLLMLMLVYHGEIYQIEKDDERIIEYFSCALYPYKTVIFSYVELIFYSYV